MIGLVLALVVVGIVMMLLGLWIFSIPIGLLALVLFVLFLAGWGRRAASRTPDSTAQRVTGRCYIWRVARPSLFARFRRREPVAAAPRAAGPPRRSLPHPAQLRRERRSLIRAREERLRDLGGLMLEMFRRDQFRQDLLVERCDELLTLDERLQELDTLLAATASARRPAPAARCACGAPLVWGSHFCANCGRSVGATPAVVSCANCSAPLAADAKFCAVCGHAVSGELVEALPAPRERWNRYAPGRARTASRSAHAAALHTRRARSTASNAA